MIGIPFQRYTKDFTFIVDDKKYPTSRIIADIISPIIRKMHFIDETIQEYHITTREQEKSDDDYFSHFLNLISFEKTEINSIERDHFIQYFYQLGNIDGYFELQPEYFSTLSTENAVDRLICLQQEEKFKDICNFSVSEHIRKIINFIANNFDDFEYGALKKIPINLLIEILSSSAFRISEEDKLLDFVLQVYAENRKYSVLFEYVLFKNVSESLLKSFIESFKVDDINQSIWRSFNGSHFNDKQNDENERYKANILKFEYCEGKEFEGIMKNLVKETGGNIHDNGTIEITTNNLNSGCHPKNLVDYESDNFFDPNENKNGSFVCFDFKDKLVKLSSYSIKSYTQRYLKNWSIEVSNNGENWIEVDHVENNSKLNGSNNVATFKVSKEQKEFYRFVKLTETGECWANDNRYDGDFSMIEFFGKLQLPENKK